MARIDYRVGIYCIRNVVSGRIYVGSSIDIDGRWSVHKCHLRKGVHHSPMLQRSWNKHGEDSFVFEVLEIIHAADLVEREKYWISALCTTRDFNVCPAAGSPRGLKRSPEFSAKQSARRGEKRPPVSVEHRAKIALSKIGRKASDETKAKMSAKRLGKKREPFTEEHKANISAARVGMECPWVSISNAKRAKHAASDS